MNGRSQFFVNSIEIRNFVEDIKTKLYHVND